jgi:hypothetical protein
VLEKLRALHAVLTAEAAAAPPAAAPPAPAPAAPAPASALKPAPPPAPKSFNGAAPPIRAGSARTPAPPAPAQPKQEQPVERLVVDGCNFLGRARGYELGDPASRDRFLLRLQEYARRHPAHRVVVFFDGQRASRRQTAGVEERVTSGKRPADDVMIDFVAALSPAERRRATLVTDDRALGVRGKNEGARVEPVAWLAERLQRKSPYAGEALKETGLSRKDLEEWEEYFNGPPERPGRP